MVVLEVLLYAALIIVSILLIAVVLLQQGSQGGAGILGGGSSTPLGVKAPMVLTKTTIVLAVLFFSLVIALNLYYKHFVLVKSATAQTQQIQNITAPIQNQ